MKGTYHCALRKKQKITRINLKNLFLIKTKAPKAETYTCVLFSRNTVSVVSADH